MKKNIILHLLDQKWYLMWIFLPIAAYYVSLLTGIMIIFLFPILLVAAQYAAILKNPASENPKQWWWFSGLSILFFILANALLNFIFKQLGLIPDPAFPLIIHYILAFYLSQMSAEMLLPSVFSSWQFGSWIRGNFVAAIVWIGLFLLLNLLPIPTNFSDRFWYCFGYILPSVVANGITGYFLHAGTED